jgi:uncharacterized protein (DUF58 family)
MALVSRYLDPGLVERLNQLQLSARSVVEGRTIGLHRSPVKGASIEFRQHRFYVPGDEPRRLDWRVLGRTDRTYVREFDEESNLRCVLMLDTSGSMAYGKRSPGGTKFDYAARIAASLAYLMLAQTESVGLATFGPRLSQWLAPRGGTAQLARLIEVLERVSPHAASDAAVAMHETAERLNRRSLVILLSDLLLPPDRLREGLAHLRHDRHEVIVLRVLDPDEQEFPFQRWVRFKGLEGEPSQLCEPVLVRRRYLERFKAHAASVDRTCAALGVELHTLSTKRPLADALTHFLQRRAVRQ